MAQTSLVLDAPLEKVWAVLADAHSFSRWVVGAKDIRSVEGPWPEPGSRFHHTVGVGPFTLRDNTKSLAAEERRRLLIEARARPVGRARVDLTLTPIGAGTEVTVTERFVSPAFMKLANPVLAPLVNARNAESLRRLGRIARTGATP